MTLENFAAEKREQAEELAQPEEPSGPGIGVSAILIGLERLHKDLLSLQEQRNDPAASVLYVGPTAASAPNGVTLNTTVRYRVATLILLDAGGTAFTVRQGTAVLFTIPAPAAPPTAIVPAILPLPITLENGVEFRIETTAGAGAPQWTAYLIAYADAEAKG